MTTNVWLNQVTNPTGHTLANHKYNCFHSLSVIALLVLVWILPSRLYNSSRRSGLIIVWLGSPLTMKE